MRRGQALAFWLICTLVLPLLWGMQLLQALFGSVERAQKMALAIDMCGNALFGGDPRMTISCRAGLGVMAGKGWAITLASVIDYLFGAGHCADAANEHLAGRPN